MDNNTKINLIHEIVLPYFKFEMDDFYGDRGALPYPKIEELQILMFKKKCRDKTLSLSKKEEQLMIEKIKNLNFGSVELDKYPGMGTYICVDMERTFEELCGFKYF